MQTTIDSTAVAASLVPVGYLIKEFAWSREARKYAEQAIPNALYWDTSAAIRTASTEKIDCPGKDWQTVSLAVTCDSIYVRHAPTFPALGLLMEPELNERISKFRIMRRWNEDTERGVAIKLRYRDEQREVHEIEVTPSDRCRFLTALAVGVD